MKEYIAVEKQTDSGGYIEVVSELVRCKDCKYRKFIDWGMGDCKHENGITGIAYDYMYCGYAERKSDETD